MPFLFRVSGNDRGLSFVGTLKIANNGEINETVIMAKIEHAGPKITHTHSKDKGTAVAR